MGYMRHLFFVKRGILIGSYSHQSSEALFFGGGGKGRFKLPADKAVCGDKTDSWLSISEF